MGQAKDTEKDPGEKITYGNAVITLYERANGLTALSWSEGGRDRRTTRANRDKARTWAKRKVRELAAATGQRWVSPAAADRIAWLEELAGGPELAGRLLTVLEKVKEKLSDLTQLEQAADWFIRFGPPAVTHRTVSTAVEGFITEYEAHHPSTTVRPFRSELRTFAAAHPTMELITLGHEELSRHVHRPKDDGTAPSKRTIKNRVSRWTTFFNRCEEIGWWPEGKKHPSAKVKRPRKMDDKAPEIFTPETAGRILHMVETEMIQHLPYLLIAGWLFCRPSECQRLLKSDFDFKRRLLHVTADVARKVSRERWVPIPPAVATRLEALFKLDENGELGCGPQGGQKGNPLRACRHSSQEVISAKARDLKIIDVWPSDVFRHSGITYRLQQTKNIDQTAEEAGNSPAEIRASYKRPIPPGEWKKWQAALPAAAASRT